MKQIKGLCISVIILAILGCTIENNIRKESVATTTSTNWIKESKVGKVIEESNQVNTETREILLANASADNTIIDVKEPVKSSISTDSEIIETELLASNSISHNGRTHQLKGDISHYGYGLHGSQTATGGRFDQWAMTAAHKTLPFGSVVRVTNKANGKSVVVRINDRGPYIKGRTFDLSRGAFLKIAPQKQGIIKSKNVSVQVLKLGNGKRKENR